MTTATYDVVVIGAGPTGSHTARLLALQGASVLMVEEHPEVTHWCALDDVALATGEFKDFFEDHHVRTVPSEGLTSADVAKALRILGVAVEQTD